MPLRHDLTISASVEWASMIEAVCVIEEVFAAELGRSPAEAELAYWIQFHSADVVAAVSASAEAKGNAAGVTDWYRRVLGREPDAEGLFFWMSQPSEQVALMGFLSSPEIGCGQITPRVAQTTSLASVQDREAEIVRAAGIYGVDPEMMLRIGRCESGPSLDPRAANPHSSARGVFQFMTGTWSWISGIGAPFPNADRFDPMANIHNAAWLMSRDDLGGPGHWACK